MAFAIPSLARRPRSAQCGEPCATDCPSCVGPLCGECVTSADCTDGRLCGSCGDGKLHKVEELKEADKLAFCKWLARDVLHDVVDECGEFGPFPHDEPARCVEIYAVSCTKTVGELASCLAAYESACDAACAPCRRTCASTPSLTGCVACVGPGPTSIPEEKLCDGEYDCGGGWDEGCCSEEDESSARCDGYVHCPNGRDELDCDQ